MHDLKRIDEIELDGDLCGSEGLDVNYISRVRAQYLFVQHQSLLHQGQFGDAKAAALMTLAGLILLRGPIPVSGIMTSGSTAMVDLAFVASCMLCIVFCLAAVFPRYPRAQTRKNLANFDLWSWPALASSSMSGQKFSEFMRSSEVSQLLHSMSLSNERVAKILARKFLMLRIAFSLAVIALVVLFFRLTLLSG